jgi:glycosyltransferase involved in cell wall biosynthesis
MHKGKKNFLIVIDQISLSTGGFWSVIDIAESLKDKYEIVFCVVGLNYLKSFKSLIQIVKKRIPLSHVLIYPLVRRRPKPSLLKNTLHFIFFHIYKVFINIYFYKKISKATIFIKDAAILFQSSFLSIQDAEILYSNLSASCIKIQNHAGSMGTLKDFSNRINDDANIKKDAYLTYLSMQNKVLLQSRLQKLEIDKAYPSLKQKTLSILPSVNEEELNIYKNKKSPYDKDGCFNIVYVATIQNRKRQDLCIDIISKILDQKAKVKLFLVGQYNDDLYYKSLCKKINEMNIQNNVFFTGYTKEFASYMWNCDLIIHPSRAEGVSRVLRESLYMGKAIIASDLEGNRDLFHKYNSAILIKSPNAELYADAALSIINNEDLRLSYEKRARISYDKQLSFKTYQQNVINVFS